jgi:hypothetical protein
VIAAGESRDRYAALEGDLLEPFALEPEVAASVAGPGVDGIARCVRRVVGVESAVGLRASGDGRQRTVPTETK